MEQKSNDCVSVSVRIKPIDASLVSSLQIISKQPPILLAVDRGQTYHFDEIFSEETTQEQIYEEAVRPLVEKVKKGYNSTVFAYGQTGCGKTWTMGTHPTVTHEIDSGLISRTLDDFLMPTLNPHDYQEVEICVSFIEIYNEKVFDLLDPKNGAPLPVKGFNDLGIKKQVFNSREAKGLLSLGGKNRHTGETKQNSNSSRSHAIFTIHCNIKDSNKESVARFNLVDLAGSESVRKTGNRGSTFHEGVNINKGLLSLGQVMTALANNSTHIPYRQSIVTTILQSSLNRKNFVHLIACISPDADDLAETLQTLDFAYRVKKIKNKPEVAQFISHYKRDNPALFASRLATPSKSFETPAPNKKLKLGSMMTSAIMEESICSISSLVSTSSVASDLSPVVKKYMTQMENNIMNRLESVIVDTLKRSKTSGGSRGKENEGCLTPSFSWDKVAKVVRSQMLQFTCSSSPIEGKEDDTGSLEKCRKVLDYNSSDDILNGENNSTNRRISQRLLQKKISTPLIETDTLPSPPDSPKPENANYDQNNISPDFSFKIPTVPPPKPTIRRVSQGLNLTQSNDDFVAPSICARRRSVRLEEKLTRTQKSTTCCHDELKPKRLKVTDKGKKNLPLLKVLNGALNDANSPRTNHTKRVLRILNSGTLKELESLQTVGSKTAEKIVLFRELKSGGKFNSISELSKISGFRYKKFLSDNYLRE